MYGRQMLWLGGVVAVLTLILMAMPVVAQEQESEDEQTRGYRFMTVAEVGFNDPLHHTIQFGQDGTEFDYVEEGGQSVLFPFFRLSVEGEFSDRHNIIFLWQPLDLTTRVRLNRDIVVDGATFEEGTPMRLRYSFPFYRISYLFDLLEGERTEFGVGASLQVRNATIGFESADGTLRRNRRDVGLVPILKVRGRYTFDSGLWIGGEADGFYAPGRWFNLSDSDVLGAILDASIRVGMVITPEIDGFLNLRYFGGGADGTSEDRADSGPGDGYSQNWLHLITISLGFNYQLN